VSEKRGWGKTVLGWFVVSDEDAEGQDPAASATPGATTGAGADVDALIRKYATGGGGAPSGGGPAVAGQGPLPALGEPVDLAKVYASFGVDGDERDRVSRARDLLAALPAETPAAVKKQIVEASLKSFGVPTMPRPK